jgi:protein arginine kinase activator
MVCEVCHERDAEVTLTQIVDNAVTVLRLCERCAAERGIQTNAPSPKHPLGELVASLHQQSAPPGADGTRCSFCGSTMSDFRATGRWGCARCYGTFEQGMRELLRRVHGNARHIGKAYQPPQEGVTERDNVLGELRERLRRAVESEQFELAADLRDRIRVLE